MKDVAMIDDTNQLETPDFSLLSNGTLRRYQAFFNIRGENNTVSKSKEEVVNLLKDHFNKLEVDNDKVIENFMRIEKDQTNEKNNSIRKSIRFQEKNIAKFLDSFTNTKK